ncbi:MULTISPECIES: hypothetical protein [Arthrobacter]|uniref:Uncharacterized protein n=1 Tax=Arthrobacter terricola TaxID=2547396 RepID=A0A4R5K980_9MICC|nr:MULTISPECIES: hypothetical protein [Arthrobacter]MBT8163582.1 hypothetical protein [Arthrobacter sp. GN70]TDF88578.1 hypothetical protein E1809_23675 [Arthrobacter terricola]
MAPRSYGIPSPLNRSFLDHEIALRVFGMSLQPSPIKQILFFIGGILITIWAVTATPLRDAHPGLITLFVIWALVATFYLGGLTKTKELRVVRVPALLAYLPKKAREVFVRRGSDPGGFYSMVGISHIAENGRITFDDGSAGQVYMVVGSASRLLFDEDQTAILNRRDAFWRKVPTSCSFTEITTKEPQRVVDQLANLEHRNRNLEIRDPDLIELLDEQYDILTGHVGGKFTSIHQYQLLRGRTANALRQGHQILQVEAESSSLVIKEISMLDRSETERMLRVFYQSADQAA